MQSSLQHPEEGPRVAVGTRGAPPWGNSLGPCPGVLADFLEAPQCLGWAGTEQLSPEGAGVLGQATQGPGEESDRASRPGHLGAATPNHGAWGPTERTACQAARARGQWPGASPVGACQDYPPPRLRTRLQVPRPSSQPEGVREVDMSSSQATGDCKQEAWLLAPAGLQPASPRGLSSLLQPRWPAGVWPGLGTQCLLKK